jgi:TDG/mug DNA glycosylase family protein
MNIRHKATPATRDWASLRLRDRIRPGVRVLFVGINPGVRSATVGHHFAGPSNRFWKLLYESGLVGEPIGYFEDERLGEWGYGITNLVARPTPGIGDLRFSEYAAGWRALERKIRRFQPAVVALVGVTLYRAILPLVDRGNGAAGARAKGPLGLQPITIHGARVFVLPNPSGRNAHFAYAEMRSAFRSLARYLESTGRPGVTARRSLARAPHRRGS